VSNADIRTFKYLLDEARINIDVVQHVSSISFVFPINQILNYYFAYKTKRKFGFVDASFINELSLFLVVSIWRYQYYVWHECREDNPFLDQTFTPGQCYIGTLLWT
jgi:hypothetical protein